MSNYLQKNEWDKSYDNKDNFLFTPHEEVVRFISKYIRKKIGLNNFEDINYSTNTKLLDLGCGIGRHIIFSNNMGIDSYGIDLSTTAINVAKKLANHNNIRDAHIKIKEGDITNLPWSNEYFDFAISHGVLDSVDFPVARKACFELSRVMKPKSLFYCDLISGSDSSHMPNFSGKEIIESDHENGTIQFYFNEDKVNELIKDCFVIKEWVLVKREQLNNTFFTRRHHLVLEKI